MKKFNRPNTLIGSVTVILLILISFLQVVNVGGNNASIVPINFRVQSPLQAQIVQFSQDIISEKSSKYLEHKPIYIDGNANFSATAVAENWSGNGTASNPYIIDGYSILGPEERNLIEILNSDRSFRINNCLLREGKKGIFLTNIKNGYLSNNIISNNSEAGVRLNTAGNNTISGNVISNNSGAGIYASNSERIVIYGNTFSSDLSLGIYFGMTATNNTVMWNNFFDNNPGGVSQAFDSSLDPNQNNTFTYNHWDDLTSPDVDTDGFVDESYSIEGSANNQDPHPLAAPLQIVGHPLSLPKIVSVSVPESLGPIYQALIGTIMTSLSGNISVGWIPSIDSLEHSIIYSLYLSSDSGNNWIPLISDLHSTNYLWDTTTVTDGSNYRLRVIASCSEGVTAEYTSKNTFSIQNNVTTPTSSTNTETTDGTIPGFGVLALFAPLLILSLRRRHQNKPKTFS